MAVITLSNCFRYGSPLQLPPPAAVAGVHLTMFNRSVVVTGFHCITCRKSATVAFATAGAYCFTCRTFAAAAYRSQSPPFLLTPTVVQCIMSRRSVSPAAVIIAAAAAAAAAYPSPSRPLIPAAGSRKRAVICGILYKNTSQQLHGCINDTENMKYLLIHRFKFPPSSVFDLTDEQTDITKHPTKENIIKALHWLMHGVQAGDSLVFHFSGHGSQSEDYDGDEFIGYKQTLCPLDYVTEGTITDAEINAMIVTPLPAGAKLHAIIDACYSGTMLNLPFLCRMKGSGNYKWETYRPSSRVYARTSGGEAICLSACDENQIAADTQALSKVVSTGAMTFAFVKAIEDGRAHTYGELLNAMRAIIQNPDDNPQKSLINYISYIFDVISTGSFSGKRKQEPQLTAHAMFDVYRKPFSF